MSLFASRCAGTARRILRAGGAAAFTCSIALPAGSAGAQTVDSLENAYLNWSGRHEALGGDRNVALRLGWSKAYSIEHSSASGVARLDLIGGSLHVEVDDLGREGGDVWLIDNVAGAGRSAAPEPGDRQILVGSLGRGARLRLRRAPGSRGRPRRPARTRPRPPHPDGVGERGQRPASQTNAPDDPRFG